MTKRRRRFFRRRIPEAEGGSTARIVFAVAGIAALLLFALIGGGVFSGQPLAGLEFRGAQSMVRVVFFAGVTLFILWAVIAERRGWNRDAWRLIGRRRFSRRLGKGRPGPFDNLPQPDVAADGPSERPTRTRLGRRSQPHEPLSWLHVAFLLGIILVCLGGLVVALHVFVRAF